MNQPASVRDVSGQSGRSWQVSAQNPQHASLRSLTTSHHPPRRSASVVEDPKEKRQEVATSLKSFRTFWLRPSEDFIPVPELERPSGGSSPVIQFFIEQETGARWIGKLGQISLRDKAVIEAARQHSNFLGVYADEILEKLGLAIYQLLGTEVPQSALSYQQITLKAMHPDMLLAMQLNAKDEGRIFELPHSPLMHFLSRFIDEFQPLDKKFVEYYVANAKRCGNEYVKIRAKDGELLPLRGLGKMLAAADFVYDLDCLGDSCGNAGYVIREEAAGDRYAQIVKIDAGYAFSYSDLRTDQTHNPKDRQIRVAPNQLRMQFAELAPADQREFAMTARRMLSIPYEEFASLFAQTEVMKEGIVARHWQQLLDELIARKSLFLKAFAPETDRAIVNEIETAQAKIAKKLESEQEFSPSTIKELLAQEKEEAQALAKLRVQLAVMDWKETDSEKVKECKTFQLPKIFPHFVGRKEVLAEVSKQLNQEHGSVIAQSISGIGGVGKTLLALHYAHAAVNGEQIAGQYLEYDYVVWLNAETFLEGQFQAMAEVWLDEQLEADDAIPAVYEFLQDKRSLVIFDNAENVLAIQKFLPSDDFTSSLHLLITSRSGQWGEIPTVRLGGFNIDEAYEYVEYHLGTQSREHVAKLVELLDGLPLAMSQAISYIKAGHCTFEEFEQQFYLNQANLMSHELLSEELHPKTVGTTLTLSLAQAKVQSTMAEEILGIMAYLSAENIEIRILIDGIKNSSKENILEAIEVLKSYSLISAEGEKAQVHRLVQEVMRYRHQFLSDSQSYFWKAVELLKKKSVWNVRSAETMQFTSSGIVHVQQVAKLYKEDRASVPQKLSFASLLDKAGCYQLEMTYYESALSFLKQALEIRDRLVEGDYEGLFSFNKNKIGVYIDRHEVGINLHNIAEVYRALDNISKHQEVLERLHKYMEFLRKKGFSSYEDDLLQEITRNPSKKKNRKKQQNLWKERYLTLIKPRNNSVFAEWNDCPEEAKRLAKQSLALSKINNVVEQKRRLEKAVNLAGCYFDPDHPKVADALVEIGMAHGALGDVSSQKDFLERALVIYESSYGTNHSKIANTLTKLSNVYNVSGDLKKRRELLQRALIQKESCYGPDHPKVAKALVLLSDACGSLGDTVMKKELLQRALTTYIHCYGPDHLEVAKTLFSLGITCGILGETLRKKELLEQVQIIYERHYGSDHLEVAKVLLSLSGVWGLIGNFNKKKELLEQAQIIYEHHYGSEHVEVAKVLVSLASVWGVMGNASKKKEFLEHALTIYICHYGPDHLEVAKLLISLGKVCEIMKDIPKKKECLQNALLILKANGSDYGSDDPKLAMLLFALAKAYNSPVEAPMKRTLLEDALLILNARYGLNHISIAIGLTRLADVYGDMGDMEMKRNFLERALAIEENYYGADDLEVAKTLANLSNVYAALRNPYKQKELLERALFIFKQHFGEEHPCIAIVLLRLAIAHGELEEFTKQCELSECALAMFKKCFGDQHPEVANALLILGDAYSILGKFKEQRELLKNAFSILKNQYGEEHVKVANVLVSLSRVYRMLNSPGKQRALLQKALAIQQACYDLDHIEIGITLFELASAYLTLRKYSEAKHCAEEATTIFKSYYGENHFKTQNVTILLQRCNEKLLLEESTTSICTELTRTNGVGQGPQILDLQNMDRLPTGETREKEEYSENREPVETQSSGMCIIT